MNRTKGKKKKNIIRQTNGESTPTLKKNSGVKTLQTPPHHERSCKLPQVAPLDPVHIQGSETPQGSSPQNEKTPRASSVKPGVGGG
jgi:hypothetical protein